MRSDLLYVVTCIYNPIRWQTRINHFNKFKEHMIDSGVKLYVVECSMGERPFELDKDDRIVHIPVRASTLAWNKENLLNLAIQRLPEDARYIAWIDADITFKNKNWASDTVHALQQYAVVQPWSNSLDLGPTGIPMLVNGFHMQTSFSKVWHDTGDIGTIHDNKINGPSAYAYPHPGYAWAIKKDVLNNIGGLIEVSGLGAGDHQQAMAFIGKFEKSIHGKTTKEYQDAILAWGQRAFKYVQGNVGYVNGVIEHDFHGEKGKRKYQDRWDILIKHQYNPITDIKKNIYGVIELAGNKPDMERDFDRYFRNRDEDQNILFEQ